MIKITRYSRPLVLGLMAAATSAASAQTFTPGDLVVSTYGGSTLVDGNITPIGLNQYSLTGATSASLVSSETLTGLVGENGSSSEGTIQLSGDGQYLTLGGYSPTAAANGIQAASNTANSTSFAIGSAWSKSTIALAQSAASDVPRVIATVDANGNVDSSTVLNDVYNTNNPRSAYSQDGTSFYISGQGAGATDEGGIYNVARGTNTTTGGPAPTAIFNAVSTRTVLAYNGNLYYSADQNSSKKGTQTGIFEYNGLPTGTQGSSTGTRITPVSNGLTGSSEVDYSPQGIYFANSTTLYVADTGTPKSGKAGDGGIQKWTFNGSAWTLQYTLKGMATGNETGFEAIAGQVVGGTVDLYAVSYTSGDGEANGLYAVADSLSSTTGSGETVSELESAPGIGSGNGETFKGVSFAPQVVPEPTTWAMLLAGFLMLVVGVRRSRKA